MIVLCVVYCIYCLTSVHICMYIYSVSLYTVTVDISVREHVLLIKEKVDMYDLYYKTT